MVPRISVWQRLFTAALIASLPVQVWAEPAAVARLGGPRVQAEAAADAATEVKVVLNQPAFLSGWVEYYPASCTLDSSGTWTIDKAPADGSTSTAILEDTLGNGDCPGVEFPFNALYYTWTKTAANGAKDRVEATWSTPDGGSETQSFILVLEGLVITDPSTGDAFTLDESNYTQTDPVSYTAQAGDTSTAITWSAVLKYATSGHRGNFSSTLSFSTQPEATQTETYTSMGGQITATATQGPLTDTVTATVSGASIPASSYTSVLGSLYASGATPTLLEQIATYESSYAQFTARTLYKVSALWPTESYDGGSHIGLMQVATTGGIGLAFDYNQNAQSGATLFMGNLGIATKRLNSLYKANKGLTAPTGVMIEDEALSYYNVGTGPRYWIVTKGTSGVPQWTENTAGDPQGTAYADCVRTQVVGSRSGC